MITNNDGTYITQPLYSDGKLSLRKLAVWSVVIYIILAVVFGTITSPIAKLSSLGLYLCLGCCALCILAQQRFKMTLQTFFVLLLGVALLVSCLYTPTRESTVRMYIYRYWTSAILICLVLSVVSTQEDVILILKAMALAGALLAVYMYIEYGFENLAAAEERVDDKMGNQNLLGMYCAFAVCLAFYFMYTQKKNRWFYALEIVACIPAIMFTGSRKAILIIAVAVLVFMMCYAPKRGRLLQILIAVGVVVGLFWIINSFEAFSVIQMRFEETFDVLEGGAQLNESDENRMKYLTVGMQKFLESPVFGKGFYYSESVFGTYTHNNFVELLMNNGIVGFLLYYIPYVVVFVRAYGMRKENKKMWSLVCLLLSALIICDIGAVTYYDRYILLLFALCFCLSNKKVFATQR